MGFRVQRHASTALPAKKRPSTYFIGGCVGISAGMDGCEGEKVSCLQRVSNPKHPVHIESKYFRTYCKICVQAFAQVHDTHKAACATIMP